MQGPVVVQKGSPRGRRQPA